MTYVVRVRTGVRYELVLELGVYRWVAFVELHDHKGGIKTYDETDKTHDTEEEAFKAARALGRSLSAKFPQLVNRVPE